MWHDLLPWTHRLGTAALFNFGIGQPRLSRDRAGKKSAYSPSAVMRAEMIKTLLKGTSRDKLLASYGRYFPPKAQFERLATSGRAHTSWMRCAGQASGRLSSLLPLREAMCWCATRRVPNTVAKRGHPRVTRSGPRRPVEPWSLSGMLYRKW